MAENTAIEWCDHTFNPWVGCMKVSPACDHCYAERDTPARILRAKGVETWGPQAIRHRTGKDNWRKPIQWQAKAAEFQALHGRRQRVFCASLADVFDNKVPWQWRLDLFDLISRTPNLDWLLLTKRIGNVSKMLDEIQVHGTLGDVFQNVWLGATVCNQEEADRDIPKLLDVPARVHFLSIEPLLGPVFVEDIPDPSGGVCLKPLAGLRWVGDGQGRSRVQPLGARIDWIIVGGESGPGARPMHPDWARSLRKQCAAASVPFLFKQWGNWRAAVWFDGPDADEDEGDDFVDLDRTDHIFLANDGRTWDTEGGRFMYPPLPLGHWCLMVKDGKKAAGRLLDGIEHNGFPQAV